VYFGEFCYSHCRTCWHLFEDFGVNDALSCIYFIYFSSDSNKGPFTKYIRSRGSAKAYGTRTGGGGLDAYANTMPLII